MAEAELRNASDPFELARARELASHYRWKASKADPGQFGDKLETTHKGNVGVSINMTQQDEAL